jgi:hypothetical protein
MDSTAIFGDAKEESVFSVSDKFNARYTFSHDAGSPNRENEAGMDRELSGSAIVSALAEQACKCLTRKLIAQLQGMDKGLLSGDDSGLQSTWDEICVQIQDEKSIFWDTYEATVESLLVAPVEGLPVHEREAIWLQTPQGSDWDCEDEDEREPYPVSPSEIITYVLDEYVYAEADRWTNARIRAYLDRRGGSD